MKPHVIAFFSASLLVVGGCGAFSQQPAVSLSQEDERIGMRWHGNLSSPQALVGAVQMDGAVWMSPMEADEAETEVFIEIRNATPGGEHPWEVRVGHCDSAEGTLGSMEDYPPLRISDDGTATASAAVPQRITASRRYSVAILASPRNRDLVVACGNLAPPSG